MKVQVNGEDTEFDDSVTIAQVVERLGLRTRRVAIELNRTLVERECWQSTALRSGDRVEIVQFVGGG